MNQRTQTGKARKTTGKKCFTDWVIQQMNEEERIGAGVVFGNTPYCNVHLEALDPNGFCEVCFGNFIDNEIDAAREDMRR